MITEQQAEQLINLATQINDGLRELNSKVDRVLDRMDVYAESMDNRLNSLDQTIEEIRDGIGQLVAASGTEGGEA